MAQLKEDNNGVYQMSTKCQPNDDILETEVRLGKDRLGKVRLVKDTIAKTKVSATPKKQDSEMQLQGFIDWCQKSQHRYIKLIGEWADTVKPSFSMKSQWEVYLKRNLRAAKELAVFNDNQIQDAFYMIEADIKGGLTYQPAIETLLKKLTK